MSPLIYSPSQGEMSTPLYARVSHSTTAGITSLYCQLSAYGDESIGFGVVGFSSKDFFTVFLFSILNVFAG